MFWKIQSFKFNNTRVGDNSKQECEKAWKLGEKNLEARKQVNI